MNKVDEIMEQVAILVVRALGSELYYDDQKHKLREMIEDAVKGHDRYEYIRALTTRQFDYLCQVNIDTGVEFDDVVDDMRILSKATL